MCLCVVMVVVYKWFDEVSAMPKEGFFFTAIWFHEMSISWTIQSGLIQNWCHITALPHDMANTSWLFRCRRYVQSIPKHVRRLWMVWKEHLCRCASIGIGTWFMNKLYFRHLANYCQQVFLFFRKRKWRSYSIQSSTCMHLKTTAMHLFMSVSIASGLIDHSTSTCIRCLNPAVDVGIFKARSYCSEKVHE